jgi:hypothetical protein
MQTVKTEGDSELEKEFPKSSWVVEVDPHHQDNVLFARKIK